ncbi:ParB/Srx family N-terminal domain-containing protein [Klebsiella pneumoniae]|uniref:ParB/Srx family N-terminal domain-containing protein n=1 Tax=Klebsiella pneumoniae TaxID=573 RepID=UPI001F4A88FA|nr:ParB/Srx family N-terminal domain-containing protein [Klebsiella pneumoniae]HBW3346598.1 ParB N-terminal domain-containing protein [Klebsiella pneumoniae]
MVAPTQIIFKPISAIAGYTKNARTHSAEQIAEIAASITEFGWTNPLLVDEGGELIAGHGRIAAAEMLGFEEVPVIVLAGLSEAQKKAYRLADNKIPLNAGWDDELLKVELQSLEAEGFNTELTGFNESELSDLLNDEMEIPFDTDEDNPGVDIDYLTFCRKRIPLSETESADLLRRLENFIEENGSLFGFVSHLLTGGENA